jgi:hypothetical protein
VKELHEMLKRGHVASDKDSGPQSSTPTA